MANIPPRRFIKAAPSERTETIAAILLEAFRDVRLPLPEPLSRLLCRLQSDGQRPDAREP